MKKTSLSVFLLLFLFCSETAKGKEDLSLSGSYRNLLLSSRTLPDGIGYYVDSNRLRIEATGEPVEAFSYNIQYDNHLLAGDYLLTKEYELMMSALDNLPDRQYLDLDGRVARGENYVGTTIFTGLMPW